MSVLGFEDALANIRETARRFGRFRKRWAAMDGLARFAMVSLGALLIWFALDLAITLPPLPLLLLFLSACLLAVWACVRWLVRPLLRRVHVEREALTIERLHGGLDNGLIGSLQLGAEAIGSREPTAGYSRGLIRELVIRTAQTLGAIQTRKLLDLSGTRRRILGATCVVAVAAGCMVLAHDALMNQGTRLRDAWAAVLDTLFPVSMKVEPGNLAVVRGRPVTLAVTVQGARRRTAALQLTDAGTGETAVIALPELTNEKTSYRVDSAEKSLTYRFRHGSRLSDEYRISVDDLPEIKTINYELTPPAYTGQAMRMITGRVPRLQGLAGTGILVSFAATTQLSPGLCYAKWRQSGQVQQVDISGRFGSFSFVIDRPESVTTYLTGHFGRGFEMAEPLSIEIDVQPDRPPTIEPLIRERDLMLAPEEATELKLPWLAQDDFGVQEVSLVFEVNTINELLGRGKRDGKLVQVVDPPRDRVKGRFEKLFASLQPPLAPGDKAAIILSARDNNTETGPGMGRSQPIEVLVIGRDIGARFSEGEYGFGERRESSLLLRAVAQVKRSTDLLQDPVKTDRTETQQEFNKHQLKAIPGRESMLGVSEDSVGLYLELLSGGQ